MKKIIHSLLLASLLMSFSQAELPVYMMPKGSKGGLVLLIKGDAQGVTYVTQKGSTDYKQVSTKQLDGIYFLTPKAYLEAQVAYEKGDYTKSQELLQKCIQDYQNFKGVKGNFSDLAWYEKLAIDFQIKGESALVAASGELASFNKDALDNKGHQLQVELWSEIWSLIQEGNKWKKMLRSVEPLLDSKEISLEIRAQLNYLKGLASEKDGKAADAIAAYQQVLIYGRPNQAYFKQNLLNLLALQTKDPQAIAYLKTSTPSEVKLNQAGVKVVAEVSGLIKMYEAFYPKENIQNEYLQWKGYYVKQKKSKDAEETKEEPAA